MFFYLSKIFWAILDPGNAFVILLVVGLVLLATRYRKLGKIVIAGDLLFAAVLTFSPITSWMYATLENRFEIPRELPNNVTGIVVLGGVVHPQLSVLHGTPVINGAVERITVSAELAKKFPSAKLVYSGGSGSVLDQKNKEAPLIVDLYQSLGVDPSRLTIEPKARNTWENGEYSLALARPNSGENWIVVTSAFHMARAVGVFRKLSWEIIPYPVDFRSHPEQSLTIPFSVRGGLNVLANALHEWIGLSAYWLTGRSSSLFPRP